eukprot:837164-Prorocentrum_minimum.AAC.1
MRRGRVQRVIHLRHVPNSYCYFNILLGPYYCDAYLTALGVRRGWEQGGFGGTRRPGVGDRRSDLH